MQGVEFGEAPARAQQFKKHVVSDGERDGMVLAIRGVLVSTGRDGERKPKVVVDISVKDDGKVPVLLPMWVPPIVLPAQNGRRSSRLYEILSKWQLVADFEDRFPGRFQLDDMESVTELCLWLQDELVGDVVCVRTRTTTSAASGERYSLVDEVVRIVRRARNHGRARR